MEISSKRRKTAELSTEQRSAIIFGHKNGISQSKLANEFECSRRTIYNTLKRFEEYQLLENLPRTGRPPKLSTRAYNCLYL
jgi:transposase